MLKVWHRTPRCKAVVYDLVAITDVCLQSLPIQDPQNTSCARYDSCVLKFGQRFGDPRAANTKHRRQQLMCDGKISLIHAIMS